MSTVTHSAADPTAWVCVARLDELQRSGVMVVRPGGRQLALFVTPQGPRACNNRCPHEGYPLSEGTLSEGTPSEGTSGEGKLDGRCLLTCNWHNWKFALDSGENLYGGDRLRTYPVDVRGDEVWVDLSEPPLAERHAAILASLAAAFDDNDYERMARELSRLQLLGSDPMDAVRQAIHTTAARLEFGWTHAFAGTTDWLTLRAEHAADPEVALSCLLEAIGHMADDVLRRPEHPYTQTRLPYDEDAFTAAIENEDETSAVAMLRGGLAAGLRFADFERGLACAALAHYNAFGHSTIYVGKAERLITAAGESVTEPVLAALIRQLIFARREDLVPEFRRYSDALARFGTGSATPAAGDWQGLGVNKAMERTVAVSGTAPEAIFTALLGANAINLLRYDVAQQNKVRIKTDDNIGWLDFTHSITFAEAAARLCARHPALWPAALLQMACFVGRNARYTTATADDRRWHVGDSQAFFAKEIARVLDHPVDEFIVSVHLLKTLLASRELARRDLPEPVRTALLAGVNRFLHSPVRLKHVRRTVHQALAFVVKDV